MNKESILVVIKKKKITYEDLKKELSVVLVADELILKDILNELLDSGVIGFINNKYQYLDDSDIILAKVINKKRNSVILKKIKDNSEIEIFGDESRYLLINDLIYVKKILGIYHGIDYYKPVTTLKGRFTLTNSGSGKVIVDYLDKCGINVVFKNKPKVDLNEGDLIQVKIVSYDHNVFIVGFENILVKANSLGSDIEMIVASYDAPSDFSSDAIKEAKSIKEELSKEDLINRIDLRNELIYTIDGINSRDFDDAVSIKRINNGYEIGVHIADVTHYVKYHHPLDDDAKDRGTSIYLADRVIPMIPLELSNGICSLNPNVDRLTISVIMKIDLKGYVIDSKIYKSVINSKARLNYDEVNNLYQNNKSNLPKEIIESLKLLLEASSVIRKKREKNGAINLETTELKFLLDENNNPIKVIKEVSGLSENMIEDLMVSANVEVAKKLKDNNIPLLYRVHEPPLKDKYELFKSLIKKMDYLLFLQLPKFENINSLKLNDFINNIQNANLKTIYSYLLLRTMSKARYSSEEIGHFGLNELYYCHFTSPIRRYPDIVIHHLIKDYLLGQRSFNYKDLNNHLDKLGLELSNCEVRADQIEREVNSLLACKYMLSQKGKTFKAKIVSFIKKGMFVETNIGIEGFVPFHLTGFDLIKYEFVKDNLVGFKNDKSFYTYGSEIDIVPIDINIPKLEITFATKSFYDSTLYNLSSDELSSILLYGINDSKKKKDRDLIYISEKRHNKHSNKKDNSKNKYYNNKRNNNKHSNIKNHKHTKSNKHSHRKRR